MSLKHYNPNKGIAPAPEAELYHLYERIAYILAKDPIKHQRKMREFRTKS